MPGLKHLGEVSYLGEGRGGQSLDESSRVGVGHLRGEDLAKTIGQVVPEGEVEVGTLDQIEVTLTCICARNITYTQMSQYDVFDCKKLTLVAIRKESTTCAINILDKISVKPLFLQFLPKVYYKKYIQLTHAHVTVVCFDP